MVAQENTVKHNIAIRLFEPPAAPAQGPVKIILLKLGERIGDFVTAIEAFRVIRHAFAPAEITLVCMPSIVKLAENTGLFDRVIGFALVHDVMNEGKVPKMDGEDQTAAFTALLDGPYLFAADFRHDGSTRAWLDPIDATYRAGFAAPTRKRLDIMLPQMEWDVPTAAMAHQDLPLHTETRVTLLAHAIVETLKDKTPAANLFPVPQGMDQVPAYAALRDDKRMKIGVCMGAGSALRQWRSDYWINLLQHIIKTHNAHVVFFGGPEDKPATQAVIDALPFGSTVDLTAAFPLADLPVYMQQIDSYIGCDTGLTHLAAGLGIPTVNIFAGISNVSVWRAKGPKVKTVYAETLCAPCHLRAAKDCPNGNICMTAILPQIVYACFEQVMTLS